MNATLLRRSSVLAITALAMALGSASATADDIVNNLDTSIDADAEIMPLTVGGSNGTTTLSVNETGTGNNPADGKPGCNLTGQTSLTVSVASTDPTIATVSPSSVTFTSCSATATITVTPVRAGSTTVSLSQTANTTGASFNLTPAAFQVDVSATETNTAPVVEVTGVSTGSTYEYGAVPVAGCSVTDAEDGDSTFAATLSEMTGPLAAFGLGQQTATCTYSDDGNSDGDDVLTATSSATYTIVDTTNPVITFESQAPVANEAGWNNTDVTLTWSCTDNVAVDASASTLSQTITTEGANLGATGTCTDVTGNTASDTQTGIRIDRTAPTLSWVGGPADGDSHYFGAVPAAPTCEAQDTLSGPLDCAVTGYATTVGDHTMVATAHDVAGNSATESRRYSVLAWTLSGFRQPVDMGGTWNSVKGGSTVPLKFTVHAGTTELTDISVVDSFVVKGVACPNTGVTTDDIELVTTGSTSLRYDTTGGQFIQNWQTPKKSGVCYQVTMTTDDGSTISANFTLK
ncbi:PxKF domain-containing protein [Knoellia aerolata]|uniref:Ig-like domain-containing protein n=1 Tax=Knoellia aerolata DSM 18566 TaxID=1385519 RepID=A0A0A0JW93_9MICO|nr:PxKF domain-containing protein [Knoellia aerolata]KGN41685.1 hypothetical protein N801_06580 [Knoellia aerolata DSM 18566]